MRDKKERPRRGKIGEYDEGDGRKGSGSGDHDPPTSRSKANGCKARRVELRGR